MKVNGYNPISYINQVYKSNSERVKADRDETGKASLEDRIELSDASKDIRNYIDKAKGLSIRNQDKTDRIRQALDSGTYSISPDQLAQAILERITDQQHGRR
ncbi:MAG TPA: flagellar biosynthesis anti-sigma factor FlgM [Candidatus Atribacteria bacterium]|nr:flagellar biosynthesis anti-sigma factor FlgM [Candidatus Atribacteria bacterium]HPT78063.1 flagellar biosynthesis anti-sigma factor FlgM [Candidatus Atribacteria bacterium]